MKEIFTSFKFGFLAVLLFSAGCVSSSNSNAPLSANTPPVETKTSAPVETKTSTPLAPARKIENGVVMHQTRLAKDDEASDVWIYLPEKPASEKLPVVLITAAGSYLWNGTALDEDDRPEHLPYVRKGFAVIAYETPGSLDDVDDASDAQILTAARAFMNSKAGLVQQQNALNYALEKVPSLDAERIYIAGHSSAATHALLAAANEPRIKAAVAYAPATDLEQRLASILLHERDVPGFKNFIIQSSPKNNVAQIKCPVFIFQATDDSVVPIADTKVFVAELQKLNSNVDFVTVNEGDHYDSMIGQGIPKAIEWLKKLAFDQKPSVKSAK